LDVEVNGVDFAPPDEGATKTIKAVLR
jgi:hypothetical protein